MDGRDRRTGPRDRDDRGHAHDHADGESVRDGLVALSRRVQPERAETVGSEPQAARDELIPAQESGDSGPEAERTAEWQARGRRLPLARPEIAGELRRGPAQVRPEPPQPLPAPRVRLHVDMSGSGRVHRAGRDQRITER